MLHVFNLNRPPEDPSKTYVLHFLMSSAWRWNSCILFYWQDWSRRHFSSSGKIVFMRHRGLILNVSYSNQSVLQLHIKDNFFTWKHYIFSTIRSLFSLYDMKVTFIAHLSCKLGWTLLIIFPFLSVRKL